MKRLFTLALLLTFLLNPVSGPAHSIQDSAFPGAESQWYGYERHDFKFNDRNAIVVAPREALPGKPWIWRPAFFNAFPSVDRAMLALGYHVAYYDLTHLYGSPRAVQLGTEFFNEMVSRYGLKNKVIVEGFSRGGRIRSHAFTSMPLSAMLRAGRAENRRSCGTISSPNGISAKTTWLVSKAIRSTT